MFAHREQFAVSHLVERGLDILLDVTPGPVVNLALYRAATQSSAFDYHLAAQLVTDGIVETTVPRWLAVSTREDGALPKHARAHPVDDNVVSRVDVPGPGWVGFELGGEIQPQLGLELWSVAGPFISPLLEFGLDTDFSRLGDEVAALEAAGVDVAAQRQEPATVVAARSNSPSNSGFSSVPMW